MTFFYSDKKKQQNLIEFEFSNIKSLGKAEVFFISVASPVFSENPPKFHQKSQIYRTPLTGGLAKRSAKIKITPIPNSSLIPCFDMPF